MQRQINGQTDQITYWEIGGTAPVGLPRSRKKTELKAWHVFLFFAVDMVIFLFAGSLVQYYLGMAGVAITEVYLLATSVLFVWMMGADFRTVFPLKKIRPLALAGTLVIWIGGFLAVIISNLILLYLFPESFMGNSEAFTVVVEAVPWGIAFLIIAVLPAICEEAMHRGVIQRGIQNSVKGKWQIVLIMGLFFGAFHMSPIKFLGTGILGAVMSYLLLVTDNMAYSSFLHFFHNALQVLLMMALPALAKAPLLNAAPELSIMDITPGMTLFAIGIYIMLFGTGIPVLLYTGAWMVKRATAPIRPAFLPKGREKASLCTILIPTFAILLTGVFLWLSGLSQIMSEVAAGSAIW